MELQQRIENFLKEAMREKNETKKDAVRMLLTAMKMKEKEIKRRPGEQEEVLREMAVRCLAPVEARPVVPNLG